MYDADPGRPRAAGLLLTVGAVVFLVGGLLHPPTPHDIDERMAEIADNHTLQVVGHWLLAAGSAIMASAALLVVSGRLSIARGALAAASWAVIPVALAVFMVTALVEASVIADFAEAGDAVAFGQWESLVSALAASLSVFAVALAGAALAQVLDADPLVPRWASGVGVAGALFGVTIPFFLWMDFDSSNMGIPIVLALVWVAWAGVRLWQRGEVRGDGVT